MADMSDEHRAWQDQWRDAFEGAEVPPAAHVWENIENQLARQESNKYRRGFLIYRGVAATALLLVAGLLWYIMTRPDRTDTYSSRSDTERVSPSASPAPLSQRSESPFTEDDTASSGGQVPLPPADNGTNRVRPKPSDAKVPDRPRTPAETIPSPLAYQGTNFESPPSDQSGDTPPRSRGNIREGQPQSMLTTESASPAYVRGTSTRSGQRRTSGVSVARVASQSVAAAAPLLPSLADVRTLYQVPRAWVDGEEETQEKERPSLFAGMALAPSYFDPQFETPAASFNTLRPGGPGAAPAQFDDSRAPAPPLTSSEAGVDNRRELSFTYGVDVGMKLSKHWTVESGVDYSRFSTSSATRWTVADVASGERFPYVVANSEALNYSLSDNVRPAPIASTAVNNDYEFISVPMKVGYRVTVSKFQFTVSSGVAANLFLGNDISATEEDFANYRVSASTQGSPFKNLYYSGVLSGGLNYNVLGHYFLSLIPSYSFAISDLTEAESGISSRPYSFGVNMGVQYQF